MKLPSAHVFVARTVAFFVWPLVVALVVTAAASALWTVAMGRGFVRTFDVALCLVGGVLLIFGAGAITFQITWQGPGGAEGRQRPRRARKQLPPT